MIKDKNPLKNYCTDKLKLKKYIKKKLGDNYTPKLYVRSKNAKDLIRNIKDYKNHPLSYVVKANNDSGSATIIKNRILGNFDIAKLEIFKNQTYIHYHSGEWFYKGIDYECFSEQYLGDNLTDYKFHCLYGQPKFCQVIRDRQIGQTNEVCVDLKGNCFDFHFDEEFKLVKKFVIPNNWKRMIEIATLLSKDFDYVRVDLYNTNIESFSDESIFVGELTFSPKAGNYKGKGQKIVGELLN